MKTNRTDMESWEVTAGSQLSEAERNKILYDWNPAPTPYPESTVQSLFEKQASERGESVALIFNEKRLTYRDLNERANRLACYLMTSGVQAGQAVAIFLERGLEQIIAMLAVLKAGAVYVPLDTEFPPERITQMLEDAKPCCILSHSSVAERLVKVDDTTLLSLDELEEELQSLSGSNPSVECRADSLAYIMFTSGSTGRPKGVEVVHRGIIRLLFGVDYVPLNTDTIILHMAATSFDASTFEIWGALLHGGTCVLCPSRVPTLDMMRHLLAEYHVNTFWMTAALFNLVIAEAPEILQSVKYLLAGGEALSPWHVEKALRELPEIQLINGYGPTENTTFSTTYAFDRATFDPDLPIPIGRAIGNSTCYILDDTLNPVQVGVPGDLYVGGDGLSRGYANRPDLTAEAFLPDPFSAKPGARMYKTGDRACWNREGLIEFIGRVDNQVKLRGFRIELQEIDIALGAYPGVEQAVTVVYEDDVRGRWLASYVKVVDPGKFAVEELDKFAYEKLPDYMVPAAFVPVAEWSFTPSGKLDRKALPKPELSPSSGLGALPPETDTEKELVQIWGRILQLNCIGISDSFFDIGGDSLRGVQLFHEINHRFGCDLPLSTLTQHPVIRDLAGVIDRHQGVNQISGYRSLQVIQEGNPEVTPLLLVHGGAGNVVIFREFALNLGAEQPVYAFQWSGWDGFRGHRTLKEMATLYKEEILHYHPSKRYRLGGHCVGGLIAIELAYELRNAGVEVEGPLILSDCPNLGSSSYRPLEPELTAASLKAFNRMVGDLHFRKSKSSVDAASPVHVHPSAPGLAGRVKSIPMVIPLVRWVRSFPATMGIRLKLVLGHKVPIEQRPLYAISSLVRAVQRHKVVKYDGDILYFRSNCTFGRDMGMRGWWDDCFMGFGELCDGAFSGHVLGGGHDDPLRSPAAARMVKQCFEDSRRESLNLK